MCCRERLWPFRGIYWDNHRPPAQRNQPPTTAVIAWGVSPAPQVGLSCPSARNDSGGRKMVPFRRNAAVIDDVYCGTVITVPYGGGSK